MTLLFQASTPLKLSLDCPFLLFSYNVCFIFKRLDIRDYFHRAVHFKIQDNLFRYECNSSKQSNALRGSASPASLLARFFLPLSFLFRPPECSSVLGCAFGLVYFQMGYSRRTSSK